MIVLTDHIRLKEQAVGNNQLQVRQNEEMVQYTLHTVEKAYLLFGEHITSTMRESSIALLNRYEKQPSFDEWDFQALKQELGMDIYIIDSNDVITHSSLAENVGLDFAECCIKLKGMLDETRASGQFSADGMDIEQITGKIKKYSYMATRDKKYIARLFPSGRCDFQGI
ncbi:hypothetical protein [Paenibacillus spongiae]|uniref:Uncharacterized protein n=1 Tax=Paenibacillus spongiae TaxID=2909671 RepID=A0ABY5SE55_9BACL|nr:hypothetical protein [Paenibacillus spongiae]UVI31047.1 hypothetical protein L1F29_04110 [Paenibacillus spongiae]